jgi:hypothetical protein
MLQETVIKSFAVADAVAASIKSNTRHDDQIRLVRLVINSGAAWLENAKTSLAELFKRLNLAQNHVMAADRRIKNSFAGRKGSQDNQPGIDFILCSGIECDALRTVVFPQCNQVLLRPLA